MKTILRFSQRQVASSAGEHGENENPQAIRLECTSCNHSAEHPGCVGSAAWNHWYWTWEIAGRNTCAHALSRHLDNNVTRKHCWLTTIHEALPSLISRRILACGSRIPLPKTVQVLGSLAGLDWFMGTWAHGQIYGIEIQSKVCQKIWGNFFLTLLKFLPESVLYLSLSWMWVVDGMAGVFRALYLLGRESSKKNPRNQSWDLNYLNPKACLSAGPLAEQWRNYLNWFVFDILTCSLRHPSQ